MGRKRRWKWVKRFRGVYKISDDGKVKSVGRFVKGKANKPRWISTKLLTAFDGGRGYLFVNLCRNNRWRKTAIARLVAEAFVPNPENKPEVNHKDFGITNNYYTNLEWLTRPEHVAHTKAGGRYIGRRRHGMKLTKRKVRLIKDRLAAGERQKDIAADFNVGQPTISEINTGRTWYILA